MLAVRFNAVGKPLEVTDVPMPEPGPEEVRVRVAACGVCASDLHVFDGSLPTRSEPPVTPGHEASGTISAVGEGVTGWSVGERVVIYAGKACGMCPACRGRRALEECYFPLTMGVDWDGAWADEVVVPAAGIVRLPDDIPFDIGAILADAVGTPFNAVTETGQVRPGERVAIFGIGGLGTHAVQIARLAGAGLVVAVDPSPAARQRALELGADAVFEPEGAPAAIRSVTEGEGVNVAFDFVGVNAVLKSAVASLGRFGRAVIVGVSGEPITLGPSITFTYFQTRLIGSYGYARRHLEALTRLVSSGRLDLSRSISAKLPIEHAEEGVRMLREKEGDPVRIVLVPH